MTEDMLGADICRVCRSEGLADRPLFHPCICTGSIKWIHQECLIQWMRYSRKEYCELCGYRFSFTPIYSPDMPRRVPLKDVIGGLISSIVRAVKYWLHYTLVAIAWLGIVPLTACRTYRALFSGPLDLVRIMSLPMDILSTENISSDVFHGCFVVTCTLFAFIGIVWLREQILHAGGPDWLERDNVQLPPVDNPPPHVEVPAQQHQEQRALRQQEIQDNNNVPPFVDDPPILPNHSNNDNLRNVEGQRAEEIDLSNNQRIGDGEGIGGRDVEQHIADRSGAEQQVEQPHRDMEARNVEQPVPPRDELAADAEQANVGGGEGWRDQVQGQAQGEAEEANWIPLEWDRPAEELTWERLLGLDGSLLFLEHVFWVVSLNTLFIMVFAFCPYHIGSFAITGLGLQEYAAASHFEGLVTTLCGYCVIGVCLVVLHTLAALLGFQRSQRILGLCYVIVKVSLLSVVEIGVLPLVCGWWLDICSLAMFDATLRDRESSFRLAPGTSMFIHWLVGMIYIYYVASFILLLREVLRPGVLWFLRNLNDPDFSPIQEMIHLPILRHVRRLVTSAVIFGTAILLMLWLPVKLLRWAWPGFLPYTVTVQSEAQVSELSLELLLLQVILPALLEQSHTRTWLKALIRGWCRVVAWILDIQSYLLRDQTEDPDPAVIEEPQHPDLGAAHQALSQREAPKGFQPYTRPRWFPARLVGLLFCVCISLVIASLIAMTLPVWLGRRVMALWMVGAPAPSPPVLPPTLSGSETNEATVALSGRVHEVYTVACGTYVCWAAARGLALAYFWLPRGRRAVLDRVKHWAIIGVKASVAFFLLVGLIPLLFGLLLELVVVVPLRVPLEQNPILFIWQDWALGVLYTKIATAITMMGPDWRIRLAIERAYNDGIREIDLKFIVTELAAPVICCFGLALAVPYAVAYGIIPLLITNLQTQILIARHLYPFLLLVSLVCIVIYFQIRQFKKLYEHIKNDKYLVGKRLVNYEHRNKSQSQQQPQASS
ncbi:membrane-associated ring finger (C3HC4) 6 [Megachile rotundata]|uniref:membrane-associated ring finger (C3HC4) 6 n=1 Tax=Megachile rotundata TaxID=143995 RepID=UPI000258DFC0|nr:PREDICTED: E3 ubiquitin-protein ligase MARCH6 [Megachile rotundata]XP_012139430.1 PREDICTED: E3 ubiquitin-protein ligase MARCH6 [Megachile rotundata]XP_012139431.1 PREDICTED: E3 ubiquitin-protein ligase MARCH6 [Megachile rotundata]XP_012139432.1 PREDICTED: E3 ubiquitin-protein ligase MARCH6 [Megachile rotundata]